MFPSLSSLISFGVSVSKKWYNNSVLINSIFIDKINSPIKLKMDNNYQLIIIMAYSQRNLLLIFIEF